MKAVFQCGLLVVVAALCAGAPDIAWASSISQVLCNVIDIIIGSAGRAIATLSIIFIGIGAMFGKVSWGLAITVAVGISVIFNAGGIITAVTGLGLSAGCINPNLY